MVLISLLLLSGCSLSGLSTQSQYEIKQGRLSLHNWDYDTGEIIRLNGEWEFYWKDSLTQNKEAKQYITVPSTWHRNIDQPPLGYGSYRLVIENVSNDQQLGLSLPTVSTAYVLWINGEKVASSGEIGVTEQETVPYFKPQDVFFYAENSQVEVVMEVANFHYRDGGIWESINFGNANDIKDRSFTIIAFELIIFGALLLSGLYHVVLFILRKQNLSMLLFSLVCFIVSIRILVTKKMLITQFFPFIQWEYIIKMEYLTFYCSVPLFCWVLHMLYPRQFSKLFCKILTIISLVSSLFVIVTVPKVFTQSIIIYQIVTLLGIIYVSFALIRALKEKEEGALFVNLCAGFLSITVINDILSVNSIIHTYNLSSLGLFVFIFSQSSIIAHRSEKAFSEMERVSNELAILNKTLEEKVHERTISLQNSRDELEKANKQLRNLSYEDQLTKIPNRRYFDSTFEHNWLNALKVEQMISVAYIDIDYFKLYNDTYGHEAGDECLKKVASTLKTTLRDYEGHIARIGGEEFIAIFTHLDNDELHQVCENCRLAISQLDIPHEGSLISNRVTVSIGAAQVIPTKNIKRNELIKAADESLYKAKEKGRNQIVIATL